MALPLTPEVLEGAYEYLRRTKPFCDWNLPEPEDVKFKVSRAKDGTLGLYCHDQYERGVVQSITIFSRNIRRTHALTETMAHEMVHMHIALTGMWGGPKADPHGKVFKTLASRVCRYHGFDPGLF